MYFCSQTLNNIIDRAFPKQILKFQNAVKLQVTVFLLKYLLIKIFFFFFTMGELKVFFPLVICFFHTEENYISYLSQL